MRAMRAMTLNVRAIPRTKPDRAKRTSCATTHQNTVAPTIQDVPGRIAIQAGLTLNYQIEKMSGNTGLQKN